jgi:ankyrin repeat protein
MTNEEQNVLDEKLLAACKAGAAVEVITLLTQGADVDSGTDTEKYLPLIWAANNGHMEVVKILLAHGADRDGRAGGKNAAEWALMRGHTDIVKKLHERPDQIVLQQSLGDRTLEEVFNFTSFERITLIRKSPEGAVEAVTRGPFSEVVDQSRLRKAFEEHIRRGGKTDENRVFPNVLSKTKAPKHGT